MADRIDNHTKTGGEQRESKNKAGSGASLESSPEIQAVFQELKVRRKHRVRDILREWWVLIVWVKFPSALHYITLHRIASHRGADYEAWSSFNSNRNPYISLPFVVPFRDSASAMRSSLTRATVCDHSDRRDGHRCGENRRSHCYL